MDVTERKLRIWDLVVRGGATTLITLLIGLLGYFGNQRLAELEQQWKAAELRQARERSVIEITNSQEELETNIATRLLENLMQEFFPANHTGQDEESLEKQIFLLRLTALNFQDISVNLKPFFEQVDRKLPDGQDRQRLRSYAQEVSGRQAYRLTFEAGIDLGRFPVKEGETISLPVPPVDGEDTTLKIHKVMEDHITVTVTAPVQRKIGPFEVSYYDMPLIDNIKLKALDVRLALLLLDSSPSNKTAALRIVTFQPYMAADRFDLHEEARKLRVQ